MNTPHQKNNTSCLCERLGENYFFYSQDVNGNFTFVSSGVTRLLGYSAEEFLNNYATYLTDAPENCKVFEYTEQTIAGNIQDAYELEIYKKDQSTCWLEINELPVFDEAKQVIAVEGIARDISENKQYEHTLKKLLHRNKQYDNLQAALDAAHAGTFNYDVVNEKTWWDKKSYDIFDINQQSYPSPFNKWKSLALEGDCDDAEQEFRQALESDETHFELTYRIEVSSHKIRWINVKAQITRNKQGQALWVDGLHLNITSTKELENRLLESELRFRSLVESSPDWIWETNTKGHYRYTSPYIKDLLGYEPQEILGQTLFSLMPGDVRLRLVPVFQRYFRKQCSFSGIESINLHKNGSTVYIETNASPMFDLDGEFTGYRGIHRNITERVISKKLKVEKEIAELANTSKSEFLANMSHELRTPMHAILSFSRFGVNKFNTAPAEKLLSYFEKINQSGERLLSLLNDLLDLSKLEAGKLEFNFSQYDLNSSLKHALSEYEGLIENKQLKLNLIKPECDTSACFDNVKITQVITNFLSNAVKFSEKGSTLLIDIKEDKLFSDTGNIRALRLSVTDRGVGIPDNELETIFDKFIQSSKTKTNAGGTGLGLAICKEFIEAHHGRIWAEHNSNSGSTFNFVIPLEQSNQK